MGALIFYDIHFSVIIDTNKNPQIPIWVSVALVMDKDGERLPRLNTSLTQSNLTKDDDRLNTAPRGRADGFNHVLSGEPTSNGNLFEIPDENPTMKDEVLYSLMLMRDSKLNLLLAFAPLAVFGSRMGILGEFQCFCCAGLALIPCAER